MKTITIFGSWWGGNSGDTSILYATMENLPQEKVEKVIVYSSNPDLLQYYLDEFEFVEVRKSVTNYWGKVTFQSIRESDTVIIGGGGLIFSKKMHDPFYSHILNIYPIVRIAKIVGTDVKLHAIGASHLESAISKFVTKSIVNHAGSVTVRDEKSLEILGEFGNNIIKVVSDPAFLLSDNPTDRVTDFISEFDQPFITVSLHSDIDKYATETKEQIAKQVLEEVSEYAMKNEYAILLYNNYRDDDWLRTLGSQINSS